MPLKSGYFWFTNGDLGASTPVPRTIIEDDFLNAVQEEIAACIEYQGTALNAATEISTAMDQLNDAIGQSWVTFTTAAAAGALTQLEGRNATATRNADGDYTVTWDNDYADLNYCVTATAGWVGSTTTNLICIVTTMAVGSCKILVYTDAGSLHQAVDMRINVRATGSVA